MPQERVSVRKMKELLRLKYDLKLSQTQIARSCNIGQSSVFRYLKRFEESGLVWPLPAECDDRLLEELLFSRAGEQAGDRPPIEFAALDRQLQAHKHVTLQLLWEEYRTAQPNGYRYSYFCQMYRRWKSAQNVVLRQNHRAGEKLWVDWAGATVPIHHAGTGEIVDQASIFVAALGASSYTFAVAALRQDLRNWIDCHVRAFGFYGGCPILVVPDNPKTGVTRACRYEPDLNRTYLEMAQHYGVAILPARPRKPRDKAKVESAVGVVQRWIVAALRHRRFFSLMELNEAIPELLEKLNQRPFRKMPGSRASLFAELDKPALKPLPKERYYTAEWKTCRANIDYHIEVDRHYYSVPYQLVGQQFETRSTLSTVEIFHHGLRVASHVRSPAAYKYTTIAEHRPKSHQAHLEWTPSRLIHWAESVGPFTAQLVCTILESKPHPEMGYRSCLGILRLLKAYSKERLEAASHRAVELRACSYRSMHSILKHSLDQQLSLDPPSERVGPEHGNVRGANYYDPPDKSQLQ
jgi:transposase